MAQNDQTPPEAAYQLTVQATIEGITAPLAISAGSINELRKAVRLLQANDLLASSQSAPASSSVAQRCPTHTRDLKPSKKPGTLFCPAQNDDGSYCSFKVKV